MRRSHVLSVLAALLLFLASAVGVGCGGDDGDQSGPDSRTAADLVADRAAPVDAVADAEVMPCPVGEHWAEAAGGCVPDEVEPDVVGQDLPREPDIVPQEEVVPDVAPPEFPLEVGDKVPDFSLPAHDGSTFSLSDYAGKKVLISSYPAATTAVCTWQTCFVNENYDQFVALNTVPVGLSTDGLGVLAQWAIDQGYQQLLLSDALPKGEVSAMFGIYNEGFGVTERANTIIGEDGTILFKKVSAMGEKPNFQVIFEFLEAN